MEKVYVFDTTLRDGEQSPGCSMHLQDKLEMAHRLQRLKVDVIEAGFAASSPGDFQAVQAISAMVKDCSVASLSRALTEDIDASCEALRGAADPLIHVFISTSPLHMAYKLRMTPEQVLERIDRSVRYARSRMANVEYSFEDASRSDREFLARCAEAAVAGGANVINIPDTVGYAAPEEMYELIEYLKTHVAGIEKVRLSVHCHDDLGSAVANTLSSVRAGARQVECTVNGIGERAGNAALEEIVMALDTRKDHYQVYTDVVTRQLSRASRTLSRIIGVPVPPNKAVVGANAFSHEAGVHQHGVLANRATYEIMTPESVGVSNDRIVLGKHSGRHAIEERLIQLNLILSKEQIDELYDSFIRLCDRKKQVTDEDLEALVAALSRDVPETYSLERFVINSGNTISATSIIKLRTPKGLQEGVALGDGPVNASYAAIDRLVRLPLALDQYGIRSVSQGGDALGEVTVKVRYKDRSIVGRGLSTDILESSILAYLNAINKIVAQEQADEKD